MPLPNAVSDPTDLLHDPRFNKGTAFTLAERDALGLRGLLPPAVTTLPEQVARVLDNIRRKSNDLEKYIFLMGLQERNRTLFYRVVVDHLEEMMPLIYTPTVGQACQEYGHIFRRPQGLFVSARDAGQVAQVLDNWPEADVRVIVVTDGERILGLGDLGANGMGIPVGKLALYTACAGVHPAQTLPITLDVGTNNPALRDDPLYIGLRQPRLRGAAYDALVAELIEAVKARYPSALLQFEDFGNSNAFRLLADYRDQLPTFNDDIQGTAAVTVAGVLGALRITGQPLSAQKILFLGAGEAGIGIGDLIVEAMFEAGLPEDEARQRCWFVDSQGLVVANRDDLKAHKVRYAHDVAFQPDLLSAIEALQPTALIGVSGVPATFTQAVVERMSAFNERPIIFALSNPTANAECTAEQAYTWSGGRAIFASGSPFAPVTLAGQTFVPGQGNNAYVFPGIGLGIVVSRARRVSDRMFLAAANTLANLTTQADLQQGRVYPPLSDIREISAQIAVAVAQVAAEEGLLADDLPANFIDVVRGSMYDPTYSNYNTVEDALTTGG